MITYRPYQHSDRDWVTLVNSHFYQRSHGFDATFLDALNAALDLLEKQISESTSTYLIAEAAKGPVGCIFLSAEPQNAARIRLFYLEEAYRGQGVGAHLLRLVLNVARENQLTKVHVSTFDRHHEACRLYESFGFRPCVKSPAEAFGQVMRQIDYELSF